MHLTIILWCKREVFFRQHPRKKRKSSSGREPRATFCSWVLSKLPKRNITRWSRAENTKLLFYNTATVEMYIKIRAKTCARKKLWRSELFTLPACCSIGLWNLFTYTWLRGSADKMIQFPNSVVFKQDLQISGILRFSQKFVYASFFGKLR